MCVCVRACMRVCVCACVCVNDVFNVLFICQNETTEFPF